MATFKKRLAIVLAVCLVVMNTVPAFAAVDNEPQTDNTKTESTFENDADVEIASPSNAETEEITEEEPVEEEEAEFFAEVKVGNVIITAKAAAGVVPKGTILKATKVVDKKVKEAIDEVVEEKREDETQVIESLKFDIQLIYNDEEIEPNGPVSIDFIFADTAANAEVNVYHILEDEETKELVEAEVLDVETVEEPEAVEENADEVKTPLVIKTESELFSYYVVEFTVGEYQYVLEGDSSVKLSEILDELNIEGTVTKAVSGAPDLFSVEKDAEGDDWTVTALQAFSSEEWMKVTIGGKEYEIIVTDAEIGNFTALQELIKNTAIDGTLTLDKDYKAESNEKFITISKNLTIDLNGHTINRNLAEAKQDGCVIKVQSGVTFTLDDNSDGETGTITGGNNSASGGGVFVGSGATFILEAGNITGNTASYDGGGVCVWDATVTMTGGSITGNTAGYGGGVNTFGVQDGRVFTMTGGSITGNTAKYGGGVYVSGTTSFIMTGGRITANTASVDGGGVNHHGTKMTVGGASQIKENFKDSAKNNVYIEAKCITVGTGESAPQNDMCIGVTAFGSAPIQITTNGTAGDEQYFFADNNAQVVQFNSAGNYLELAVKKSTCTVTYDANDATSGTAPTDSTQYTSGATVTVLGNTGNLEKAGFSFNGWNTQHDGRGTHYDVGDQFIITDNTTLYAEWIAPVYTVTFDSQGGSEVSLQMIRKDQLVPKPADPTKTDFIFAGWYKDAGCTYGNEYDFETPVTADFTLYAKWEEKWITITYLGFGGSPFLEINQPIGLPADSWPRPDWLGYVFDGWCADEACTVEWDFETLIMEDTILYSKWHNEIDPKPVKRKAASATFTGTWNNPVTYGNWTQDASGVWHYASTQTFRNTWGYIVNPYAKEGQNTADWFYFDANGNMLTGWQFIQGKWYYLNPSKDGTLGACQIGGVTPDGYVLDETGAWTGR